MNRLQFAITQAQTMSVSVAASESRIRDANVAEEAAALTKYNILTPPRWVGTDNFVKLFTDDPLFWQSVRNTLWIIVIGVPLRLAFAIFTAMLLTAPRRGVKLYRTLFYLPTLAPPVAAVLAFVVLLNPENGPVDQALGTAGLPAPLWFQDPAYAKWGLVLLGLWGVGDAMIIMLAGLLDVPRSLYEAAVTEGANAWHKFRYVTIPMLSPVILFTLVIGIINGFQYFTEGYVAGNTASGVTPGDATSTPLGEPQGSLLFYSMWLYQQGFRYFHMGYASAMAWLLFLATMVFTLLLVKTSDRWVHYGSNLG